MSDKFFKFVADGNEVLELKLVRCSDDIEDEEVRGFAPQMCHQVFGQDQTIFGYSGLRIRLYYTAGSLQTYLGIEYAEKFEPITSEETKADDIEGTMKKILAPGYTTNLDQFVSLLETEETFRPMGKMLHSFTSTSRNGGDKHTFEVYFCGTTTPGFLQFHERLQTFLLWYLDAASFIDVDDDQWTFFTVFEKYPSIYAPESGWAYALVGYATVYRYYDDYDEYPAHAHPRVSQVLTLPPFRKLGVCANLLQAIYIHFVSLPDVIDIIVEDLSEDFQRIRDYVDCKNCETLAAFHPVKLHQGISPEMVSQASAKFKVNKEQVQRVYEILRLRATNTSNKARYWYLNYRLDVENRLNAPFVKNKLELKKLEKVLKPEEYAARLTWLEVNETQGRLSGLYLTLEKEYRRVLQRLDRDYLVTVCGNL